MTEMAVVRVETFASELEKALVSVDMDAAKGVLTTGAHQLGIHPLMESVMAPALERLGEGWERGEVALAQIYMAGRVCEEVLNQLLPQGDRLSPGPFGMAIAVLEDHHQMGKRIVGSMLRAAGFEVEDLGHGLTAEELVQRTIDGGIQILLISVLMLRSALLVKDVVDGLHRAGAGTKLVVGGAPFLRDEELWKTVGATAMGRNGADAIRIVGRLVEELRCEQRR